MTKNHHAKSFLFLLPALIIFLFVVVVPFFRGVTISMTSWDGLAKNMNFVGMENYKRIFSTDTILTPLKNSLQFTAITLIFDNILGLALAVLLVASTRRASFLRVAFFMPFIISLVVSSYMWTYLYSSVLYPVFGLQNPLGNPETSNLGVALISVWRNSGYCMLIYIAGLKSIPDSLYEAARVEGAGRIASFFKVTLPLLVPSLSINITLILAWGLKEFDTVMVATGGGPGRSSMSLA
ncbi:MAG: sugar ABC transporter permease, partial [Spirochaetales bacterium]|nr:sugar ABC transporter permease [Spirochaetales bacterium]